MPTRAIYTSILFLLLSTTVRSQVNISVEPVVSMQFWGAYTIGQEVYSDADGRYMPVDNRLNFQLHRSRLGLKGSVNNRFKYNFLSSIDFVGRDLLSGTIGGTNNGASPQFRLWNAFISYQLIEESDLLHIRAGYLVPEVSRESITSPFKVNSFEKSWTQNYIRRHITGIGPGRSNGINIGGMYHVNPGVLAISYDIGAFNPIFTDLNSNSAGQMSSNLFTYRVAIHVGDPEGENYSKGRVSTYFGKRKGVTVAVSQSHQGTVEMWDNNNLLSLDILANYGPWNLTSEWAKLSRSKDLSKSVSYTWMARMSYNIPVGTKNIDIALSRMHFGGPLSQREQEQAFELKDFTGEDSYTELVFNFYASKQTKLSLAYTWRSGTPGFYDNPALGNNYFEQGGVTSIKRGDYLGAGLIFSL